MFVNTLRYIILNFLQKPIMKLGKLTPKKYGKMMDLPYLKLISIRSKLKKGHILLSRLDGTFTNPFIPGFYKHCGMYVGKGDVVEALGSHGSVTVTSIWKFLLTKDHICIVKLKDEYIDESIIDGIVTRMKSYIGKIYDLVFKKNNDMLYCSESCNDACAHMLGFDVIRTQKILGEDLYLPDDFRHSKYFEVVWESSLK